MRYASSSRNLVAVLLVVGACGGTDPRPGGPLNHGIIAGNNQLVVAAPSVDLPNAVVAALARGSTGKLELRVLPRRMFDFMVPQAYAADTGTVVTGSPVPGAVVCATTDGGLKPFAVCTNTDNNGHATFFFSTDTVAGDKVSEIRGTVNDAPTVFDTAHATVLPAAPSPDFVTEPSAYVCSPVVLPATAVRDRYGNGVPFRIVGDAFVDIAGDTIGTEAARTIVFDSSASTRVSDSNGGSTFVTRDLKLRGAGGVIGYLRYKVIDHYSGGPGYCDASGNATQAVVMTWIAKGVSASWP